MSNNKPVTKRYYPQLSEIVKINNVPAVFEFAQDGLEKFLQKLFYKNLQYDKSSKGDSAYYSLDIITGSKLSINLFNNIKLVINPDEDGSNLSSFPLNLKYSLPILSKFLPLLVSPPTIIS